MKKLILIIFISLFSYQTFAQSQTLKSEIEIREMSKKLSTLFLQQKTNTFFEVIRQYWPLPQNEIDNLEEKTIKNMNVVKDRYGVGLGLLKIKEEKISDVAIRETYMLRYKYNGLRLIFTYYKNDGGWFVNAFKWDDQWVEEFK